MASFKYINPYTRVGTGKASGIRRDNIKKYGFGTPAGTVGGYKRAVGQSLGHDVGYPVNKSQSLNSSQVSKARGAAPKVGYNGGASRATAPAGAIRGEPKTAKMVKQSSRGVPLSKSTPPTPRPVTGNVKGLGSKIKAAFAANKGKNQAKALERMKKASRR